MTDHPTPWCCAGRSGYVAECPLCPEYGTSLLEPCLGHAGSDENQTRLVVAELHARRSQPGFEYATTTGPRKQWDDVDRPPAGEMTDPDYTWERNVDAGRPGQGWDRFEYTEESYWRRPKTAAAPQEPLSAFRSVPEAPGGELARRDGDSGAEAGSGDVGWTQLEARAFNAVGPAVRDAGQWLPLSARRAVARAVLAELKPELDRLADYENRITWDTTCQSCARILDSSVRETERADRAVTALARARSLHQENCPLATGKVGRAAFTCGMCDALTDPKEQP